MINDFSTSGGLGPFHSDDLAALHGKKKSEIYVVLSKDGSTVLQDPGLDRPWSTPNKKYAEHHARLNNGVAVDLLTAIASVIQHEKNVPPGTTPPKLSDF